MTETIDHTLPLLDSHFPIAAFDFDGNILATNTPIYLIEISSGKEVPINGHELDKHPEWLYSENPHYRWHDDINLSLLHFRDYHTDERNIGPDRLIQDVKDALSRNALSASFGDLKEKFLTAARPFALITARGHSADNLARALWIINESTLSESEKDEQYENIKDLASVLHPQKKIRSRDEALRYYFTEIISIYPVSNAGVAQLLQMEGESGMSRRKVIAFTHYTQRVIHSLLSYVDLRRISFSYGFSDDSVGNMRDMIRYFIFRKKNGEIPEHHKVNLYFTGRTEDYDELKSIVPSYEERENMLVLKI